MQPKKQEFPLTKWQHFCLSTQEQNLRTRKVGECVKWGRHAANIYTCESQENFITSNLTESRLSQSTGSNGLCVRKAGAAKERCQEGHIFLCLLCSRICFKKGSKSCWQKGQASLLSMMLLKAFTAFIWEDNEVVIIST